MGCSDGSLLPHFPSNPNLSSSTNPNLPPSSSPNPNLPPFSSSPKHNFPPSSSSPCLSLPLRPKLVIRLACPKTKEQERDVESTSDDHKAKETPCKAPVKIALPSPAPLPPLPPVVRSRRSRVNLDGFWKVEKKEKVEFRISLTREEIEEDFIVMTGKPPPRRPSKRSKTEQDRLDQLYPGSSLPKTITPSRYLKDWH